MKKTILFLLLTFSFSANAQTNLTLTNLPVQINFNEGTANVYNFSAPITNIVSRNSGVISWSIAGNSVTITGIKAGRTGLKITSAGVHYYMGVRVNNPNGSIPGMPKYLSVGSVSEDLAGDLDFWKDLDIDATNKSIDIRYIYINGGPTGVNGWQSWGPNRPNNFAKESLRLGLIPFFVYYNIPDNGEDYALDLAHANDVAYMTAYFQDLNIFMDKVQSEVNGDLYGIILEPDFLGYMQQQAVPNDPNLITTAVGLNSIAPNAGTIKTLVNRINKTIADKRTSGHKIFFGWQLNLWAFGDYATSKGIMRRTDTMGFDAAKYLIGLTAKEITQYGMNAGILSNGADFISIDKYGLDAMGHINAADPSDSTWFFNNDHWKNYLHFTKTMHETSGKPIILWQIPVGRINESNYVSAYTGAVYPNVDNTSTHYEDSATNFFLGDVFHPTASNRLSYFGQNLWADTKFSNTAGNISWGNHFQEVKDAGIISVLFGAGVNSSTDGVGSPPSDNYFWIQKVQNYYQNTPIPLGATYGENPLNPCASGCNPTITFMNPVNNGKIVRSELDTANIKFFVDDADGNITAITMTIDGNTITVPNLNNLQSINWTPPTSFGWHTLVVTTTDNTSRTRTGTITFELVNFDATACGYNEWNPATVYNISNTQVAYNGLIYKNKWWTQNETPYLGGSSSPWDLIGVCQILTSTLGLNTENTTEKLSFKIIPNPAIDNFSIHFNNEMTDKITIKIIDINGKILNNFEANPIENRINLSTNNLANGLYFVQIISDSGMSFEKMVVGRN